MTKQLFEVDTILESTKSDIYYRGSIMSSLLYKAASSVVYGLMSQENATDPADPELELDDNQRQELAERQQQAEQRLADAKNIIMLCYGEVTPDYRPTAQELIDRQIENNQPVMTPYDTGIVNEQLTRQQFLIEADLFDGMMELTDRDFIEARLNEKRANLTRLLEHAEVVTAELQRLFDDALENPICLNVEWTPSENTQKMILDTVISKGKIKAKKNQIRIMSPRTKQATSVEIMANTKLIMDTVKRAEKVYGEIDSDQENAGSEPFGEEGGAKTH